jgi:hypothetical protein
MMTNILSDRHPAPKPRVSFGEPHPFVGPL